MSDIENEQEATSAAEEAEMAAEAEAAEEEETPCDCGLQDEMPEESDDDDDEDDEESDEIPFYAMDYGDDIDEEDDDFAELTDEELMDLAINLTGITDDLIDLDEEEDDEEEAPVPDKLPIDVDSRECALIAARAADSKKASDILVQNVSDLIGVTDYFIIATAANSRQVNAVVDEVEDQLKKQQGIDPLHREGTRDGSWVLLDYGSFVVHVFQPETREYYRLEALWNDAPLVDLEAEGMTDIPYSDRIARMIKQKKQGR